ncbi:MAG: ABC transporter substrate-binding protein [Deltaproteobacteria bacterium]|nr:ABC transporter substrate-binding protein [Deltaproteobacteria bacterium]
MKKILIAVLSAALLISAFGAAPVLAKDKVFYLAIPQDYSKIYTFLSRVWEKGYRDYATMINMEGGVEGYRFEFLSADHANEPQRGIELYEQYKKKGAMIMNMASTPLAHAVLPRCMKDGISLYTPMHGRGDAVIGDAFPWVFPLGATYSSKSAVLLEYIYNQESKNLKGKKIAYVHIDTAFGREVIPVLTRLGQKLGYKMRTFGYPPPGNEQASIWTQVRRFQPDWVILWGAGIGQSVAVKEALRNGIPINRITSCDWLLEQGMKIVGTEKAKGVVRVEGIAPGRDVPIIQKILKEVYGAGKGAGDERIVGSTLYNVSIALSLPYAEVVRIAVKKYGEPLTPDKLRAAFEQIKDFNCGGLTAPITTSPTDHEGGGGARVSTWDGKQFAPLTGWHVSQFRDTVLEVARESAAKYKAAGHPLKKPSIIVK